MAIHTSVRQVTEEEAASDQFAGLIIFLCVVAVLIASSL